MTDKNSTTIGYIGLGNMGEPMALNLCRAGYRIYVYARDKKKLTGVLAEGAVTCNSPSEVAAHSDVVFTCLTDTAAVETVVFQADGIADGAKAGSILVDTSTISPAATQKMATRLFSQTGMYWVDAPISGGTVGSAEGTLSIFVGGRDEDFQFLRPIFGHIGKNISNMGPLGSGQVTKLINQIMVSVSVAMLAEAVGLAERVGLDVTAIPAALAGGRGDSTAMQHYWKRLADKDFTSLSTVTSILKDIDLVQEQAKSVGAALPLTAHVRESYQILSSAGYAGEDLTALARLLGKPVNLAG